MNTCSPMCDTLRNDTDNGDECPECGTVYPDPARRHIYIATEQRTPTHELARSPTSSDMRPHMRPGWYHVVQMGGHGVGLDTRKARRVVEHQSKRQRNATPPEFRDVLTTLARSVR